MGITNLIREEFSQERVIVSFANIHKRGKLADFQRGVQLQIPAKNRQGNLRLNPFNEALRLTKKGFLGHVGTIVSGSCRAQELWTTKILFCIYKVLKLTPKQKRPYIRRCLHWPYATSSLRSVQSVEWKRSRRFFAAELIDK